MRSLLSPRSPEDPAFAAASPIAIEEQTGQVADVGSLGTGYVEARLAIEPTSGRLLTTGQLGAGADLNPIINGSSSIPSIAAPGTPHCQAYFRDAALPCNSGTLDTTNSFSVNWVP